MKKKIYIATKLENAREHNEIRDMLREYRIGITYDWTTHGSVQGQGHAVIQDVALNEAQGVRDADLVLVLWPGGRGTHAELGMALALNKPVIFATREVDHIEGGPNTCAFYHHPLVRSLLARTPEAIVRAIVDTLFEKPTTNQFAFEGRSDDTFGEYGVTNDDYDNCASGKPIRWAITTPAGEGLVVFGQHCPAGAGGWLIGVSRLPGDDDIAIPEWPIRFERSEDPRFTYTPRLIVEAPADAQVRCIETTGR